MVSFALILFVVEEPARPSTPGKPAAKLRMADCRRLPAMFWMVVAIASVLTLARFSEAFLVLKAQNIGIPIAFVPAVMVVMSAVYALTAYPAGAISDRIGRRGVLIAGTATLIVADLVLAFAGSIVVTLVGVALWGLHMGLTQGLLSAMVADTAPAELARHRLRPVQSCRRHCRAVGEHWRRRAVGRLWPGRDLYGRRSRHGGWACRPSGSRATDRRKAGLTALSPPYSPC